MPNTERAIIEDLLTHLPHAKLRRTAELPPRCYSTHPVSYDPILIVRGVAGYSIVTEDINVNSMNKMLGVSDEQVDEMVCKSMFVW